MNTQNAEMAGCSLVAMASLCRPSPMAVRL